MATVDVATATTITTKTAAKRCAITATAEVYSRKVVGVKRIAVVDNAAIHTIAICMDTDIRGAGAISVTESQLCVSGVVTKSVVVGATGSIVLTNISAGGSSATTNHTTSRVGDVATSNYRTV